MHILKPWNARYHSRCTTGMPDSSSYARHELVGGEAAGPDGEGTRRHPVDLGPTDVGEGIAESRELPVEHRADLVVDEGEVAGLRVAVHQRDPARLFGLLGDQLRQQSFERGQRTTLHAPQFATPVFELAGQEVAAVAQESEARRLRIDAVDGRDLLDHAERHARDALGRVVQLLGHTPLVHGAVEPLHHVELTAEDRPRALVPVHLRRSHRRRLERAQDPKLSFEVVGLEQPGCRRAHAQHDVAALLDSIFRPRQREQQRLRGMTELDAIESLDPHVVGAGELRREPVTQRSARVVERAISIRRSSRRGRIPR